MPLKKFIPRLVLTVLTGLGMKFYSGPGSSWAQNYGAGVMYVVFWILIFFFLFSGRQNLLRVPVMVFAATSALEFLQLWRASWLESLRGNFLGRTLIGSDFSWFDFPHYAIGSVIGYLLILDLWGNRGGA